MVCICCFSCLTVPFKQGVGGVTGLMRFPPSPQKTIGTPHYSSGLFWILDTHQSSGFSDSPLPCLGTCNALILEAFEAGECTTPQTLATTTDIWGRNPLRAAFLPGSGVKMTSKGQKREFYTLESTENMLITACSWCLYIYFLLLCSHKLKASLNPSTSKQILMQF